MRYIRPSFKMGGTPSGIETLTPRKKFQFGTPEFNFLERSLQNELRTQNEMDQFKKQNTTFNKLLRKFPYDLDVKTGKEGDLIEMGIIDPMKVTKQALQNAVSVAVTILSTNAIVTMARTYDSK